MFYRKNVGPRERIARTLMGVLMAAVGLAGIGFTPLGWALAAGGAMAVLTGLVGFCPACAMVGRQLPAPRQ